MWEKLKHIIHAKLYKSETLKWDPYFQIKNPLWSESVVGTLLISFTKLLIFGGYWNEIFYFQNLPVDGLLGSIDVH